MRWLTLVMLFLSFAVTDSVEAGCPGGRCPQASSHVRTVASVSHQPRQRRRVATVVTTSHHRVRHHR